MSENTTLDPADRLMQRLMDIHVTFDGQERNYFADDLADAVRTRWLQRHAKDIEEALNVSSYDVTRIMQFVHEVLMDWAFKESDE